MNDEPQPLYASAARRTLALIEEREPIAALLWHCSRIATTSCCRPRNC